MSADPCVQEEFFPRRYPDAPICRVHVWGQRGEEEKPGQFSSIVWKSKMKALQVDTGTDTCL